MRRSLDEHRDERRIVRKIRFDALAGRSIGEEPQHVGGDNFARNGEIAIP